MYTLLYFSSVELFCEAEMSAILFAVLLTHTYVNRCVIA